MFKTPISILSILTILLILPLSQCNQTQHIYLIFTPQCYNSLITNLNFSDTQCIKLTISKCMGYGLVLGGAIVKVPQVIKILMNKSVYGISFVAILMESLTNWVTIVYSWYRGNPFSIYGENVFLLIQNLLILLLFIIYGRNVPKGVTPPAQTKITKYTITLILFCVMMLVTQNPLNWPPILITYSMFLQILLFSSARLTQIFHIHKCKSTGSLALITCMLVLLGNLGRLFTVFVEIKEDYLFAISVVLASLLNATILAQFFVYWNNTNMEKNKLIEEGEGKQKGKMKSN